MRDVQKKLLEKEVTRKQFLQFMAGTVLALFGFSNFLSFLSHFLQPNEIAKKPNPDDIDHHGFGSRKFGA